MQRAGASGPALACGLRDPLGMGWLVPGAARLVASGAGELLTSDSARRGCLVTRYIISRKA